MKRLFVVSSEGVSGECPQGPSGASAETPRSFLLRFQTSAFLGKHSHRVTSGDVHRGDTPWAQAEGRDCPVCYENGI